MKRWLPKLGRFAGIAAVVLVALAVILPLLINVNVFRPELESRLAAAIGRPVTLGDLHLSLFTGHLKADGLTIAEDAAFGPGPFLRAESLAVGVDLKALLLERRLHVREITVENPEVSLLRQPGANWNFSTLGMTPPGAESVQATTAEADPEEDQLELAIQRLAISGGRLHIGELGGESDKESPTEWQDLRLEVRDFTRSGAFPFSAEAKLARGGRVKADGRAGPLAADTASTPFTAQVVVEDLVLANQSGTLSAVAQVLSQDSRMRVQADATVRDLKLSTRGTPADRPVKATVDLSYSQSTRSGVIDRLPLRIGEAQLDIAGTYDLTGPDPTVDLMFSGSQVPLKELAALLPALDVAIPGGSTIERGTTTIDLTSTGPVAALATTGTVHLDDTVLSNFSLSEKLKVLERFTGIQAEGKTTIATADAVISRTEAGTSIRDIVLMVPAVGKLTGAGVVSPSHDLDFRFVADLGAAGGTNIPLRVRGTTADPSFKLDAGGILQELRRDPRGTLDRAKSLIDRLRGRTK